LRLKSGTIVVLLLILIGLVMLGIEIAERRRQPSRPQPPTQTSP